MQSDKLYVQGALTATVTVLSRPMQLSFRSVNGNWANRGSRFSGKRQLFHSHPNRTAFQLRARDSFYSATLLKFQNREAHS